MASGNWRGERLKRSDASIKYQLVQILVPPGRFQTPALHNNMMIERLKKTESDRKDSVWKKELPIFSDASVISVLPSVCRNPPFLSIRKIVCRARVQSLFSKRCTLSPVSPVSLSEGVIRGHPRGRSRGHRTLRGVQISEDL